MIVNGKRLLALAPIADMLDHKAKAHGVSYGLTECGYDLRLAQDVAFYCTNGTWYHKIGGQVGRGRNVLASSMERFQMPTTIMGQVLNKSTWARKFLDASRTTNIEPGWRGHLTIELRYDGEEPLTVLAGSGVAQVIFHEIAEPAQYEGKYQDQADEPVPARES